MPLLVTYQEVVDNSGEVIRPSHWRVAVQEGDEHWVAALPLEFAREKDACWARDALLKQGLCDARSLKAAGSARVKKIMLEALPW